MNFCHDRHIITTESRYGNGINVLGSHKKGHILNHHGKVVGSRSDSYILDYKGNILSRATQQVSVY